MLKITKRILHKVLLNALFNPKDPGTMRVVLDVGNKEYYMTRAIEAIKNAQGRIDPINNLYLALRLITLTLVHEGEGADS